MGYHVSSLEELGDGYGFRKIRTPMGVTAFGVNALVFPPGYEGPAHYHDQQDELYFVHRGTATFEVDGDEHTVGEGYGFRKVRRALGVDAFGVNAVVMPPGFEGFEHYHDVQDELYFVHSGTARFEVDGEVRELGPGGLCHVPSTTHRKVSNPGTEDLVVLVVGGKDGYVSRDGQLVSMEELEKRQALAKGEL